MTANSRPVVVEAREGEIFPNRSVCLRQNFGTKLVSRKLESTTSTTSIAAHSHSNYTSRPSIRQTDRHPYQQSTRDLIHPPKCLKHSPNSRRYFTLLDKLLVSKLTEVKVHGEEVIRTTEWKPQSPWCPTRLRCKHTTLVTMV